MKKILASTMILSLLLLTGCTRNATVKPPTAQDDLTKTSQALRAILVAANGVTDVVIKDMAPGPDRDQVLGIIAKVVEADQRAGTVIKGLDGTPLTSIGQLQPILKPVLDQLRESVDSGLIGIKNEDSRAKAKAYLDSISIAINTLVAVLEIYGIN